MVNSQSIGGKKMNKMKFLRLSRGMKTWELGVKVGCGEVYLNTVENERTKASPSLLEKIAKELGTSVEKLFERAEIKD